MKELDVNNFTHIKLEEMDRVKLMNRTDTKYWFHIEHLPKLLDAVQDKYYVLNINDQIILPYSTLYYDTAEDKMFVSHHNGKLNRYKIRRRSYMLSGISFLEIKFKNNKGRTIKKRISGKFDVDGFTPQENQFISERSPFSASVLKTALNNNFSRITLVSKSFNERCTIDFNLRFETEEKDKSLDNLVIVEIKSEGLPSNSPMALALREKRIKTSGFSKYCVGRTLTDETLKRNAFKSKIRRIEKVIIQTENN